MEFLDFRLEKAVYLQPVLGDPGDGEAKELVRIGKTLPFFDVSSMGVVRLDGRLAVSGPLARIA
jgi:hypothetical protein